MANEGVIKLKGDASNLDQAVEKSSQGFRRLGEHASKAHGHAKSFGEQWQHANNHMIRTIAHTVSIGAALESVLERTKQIQEEASKASEKLGNMAVQRDLAAARLGMSSEHAENLLGGASPLSEEERTKFFSSLSEKRLGRGKLKLTSEQATQIYNARASGLVDEKTIDEHLEKGDIAGIMTEVGKASAALGPAARRALQTNTLVNSSDASKEAAQASRGDIYRASLAHFDDLVANGGDGTATGAIGAFMAKIPGIGAAGRAYYAWKEAYGYNSNQADIPAAIRDQTNELKDRKPTVAKPASGD